MIPGELQKQEEERYLDAAEAAAYLAECGIKMGKQALCERRYKTGAGPRFCYFGRFIRYPESELHAWVATCKVRFPRLNRRCRYHH
jgi:predicted DNA-binding transcriptional regulator AlpA